MSAIDAIYFFLSLMVAGFITGLTFSIFFHWGTWSS